MSRSLAERLAALPLDVREEAIRQLGDEQSARLRHDWRGFWARPAQIAPGGDWDIWLVLAGRGFGKTRTGVEWLREVVAAKQTGGRVALVAETAADARDVLVEGESGLLSIYPRAERPIYEPSKRRLTWPCGTIGSLFNATEPDQLRGPQHGAALCDELSKWKYSQESWDQLQFGLRIGPKPRVCITTTPRPIPIIREMVKRAAAGEGVVITRGGTGENRSNLAESFWKAVVERYAGTRLGRQELDAEVLDDVPGALWTRAMIDAARVREEDLPPMKRILVSVDPAVTSGEDADEHGIICGGVGEDQRGYVLDDASIQGTPDAWARRAISTLDRHGGDGVVVEVNQGGEMVAATLRSVRPSLRIIEVRASRGKHVRAEPIAALYEQGRISHIASFARLEDQMCLMTAQGYIGDRSPDRLDALVWLFTELFPAITKAVRKHEHPEPRRAPAGAASWMAR